MSADTESSNSNNACVVCYRDVEIYSIGLCEHPVCYECSTRMRVLCQQNECPICRQDLPKVVFTRNVKPFRHLRRTNLLDTRYNIYFDNLDIQEKFTILLAHACSICQEKQVFATFNGLKDHMRRQHELHYCDLCVENLRIFSCERRCYTRQNLTQHRRKGDLDDKSHKGHPLCEFCDQRYMDNDELFRHLRRDHLYCHFCDADGYHHYYNSYSDLREHFRQEHYLCEEASCLEVMLTSVFRTDIDLKAHKACTHGKHLGKAAAKQARTLELEFTLAPRGDSRNNRRLAGGPSGGNSGEGRSAGGLSSSSRRPREYNTRDQQQQQQQQHHHHHQQQQQQQQQQHGSRDYQPDIAEFGGTANIPFDTEVAAFVRQPDVRSTEEFPSLGNASSSVMPNLGQTRGRGNLTIRGTLKPQTLAITDENFPALGLDSGLSTSSGGAAAPGISKTVNLSVFSSNKGETSSQRPQSAAPNVSIHVNHKTDGTVTTRVSGPNIRIRPSQRSSMDCDFPALGRSNLSAGASTTSSNTGQWTKVTCVKPAATPPPKSKKVAPSPFAEFPPPLPSSNDFPSLSKPARSKKQLSIAVVPQQSTWLPPSNGDNEAKGAGDATKGKAKKKKVKQTSGNNSSSNESSSSKTVSNAKKDTEKSGKTENVQKNGGNGEVPKKSQVETMEVTKSGDSSKRKETKKEKRKGSSSPSPSQIFPNSFPSDKQSMETSSAESNKNNSEVVTRKRSELKIDSLNTSNNNMYRMEEQFPSLKAGKVPAGKSKLTTPPPGFATATPPPPGFAVKLNSSEQRSTRLDSGLTFTNSSGESYSILPNKNEQTKIYGYVAPLEFQKRNKSLVAKVTEVLGQQEPIQEFRYLSGLFRQGACSAEDYYKRCRSAMGLSAFETLFPEILVLLPDIDKQQELFAVHKREVNGKVKNLEACSTCGQILKPGPDHQAHLSSHTMENHFPALGDSSSALPSTTWVTRKGA